MNRKHTEHQSALKISTLIHQDFDYMNICISKKKMIITVRMTYFFYYSMMNFLLILKTLTTLSHQLKLFSRLENLQPMNRSMCFHKLRHLILFQSSKKWDESKQKRKKGLGDRGKANTSLVAPLSLFALMPYLAAQKKY